MLEPAVGASAPAGRRSGADVDDEPSAPGIDPGGTGASPGAGTAASADAPTVWRFERRAMGSPLRLTIVGVPEDRARLAWESTSALIERIEQSLSRFRETSDLIALNRRAGVAAPLPVDGFLYDAIAASHRAWRVTGGAFDPRVLGDLERLGYVGVPSGTADRPAPTGFPPGEWLVREPRGRRLAIATPVDTGGIGKGLALRWAFAALARLLPEIPEPQFAAGIFEPEEAEPEVAPTVGALLEAGGDLVARGAAPDPGPWLVGIEHPSDGTEIAAIATSDSAICTSSIAVHRWQASDGRMVHHLVDPRTGEPGGEGLRSVTVAGPDPAWAEVWSKTLFLAGGGGIGPRARHLGLAAWWVRDDGSLEMTPAGRMQTAWVVEES